MGDKFLDGFLSCLGVLLYIVLLVAMLALPLIMGACWNYWFCALYIITIPVAVGLLNMVFN